MTDLSRDLRRALETTVKAARDAADLGAADALRRLGAFEQRRPEHLTEARNTIRKRLRAHAKSLGDPLNGAEGAPLERLTESAAYVQWHRLLFARFLVERGLLRDEGGIVVSLADCREEAAMAGAGDEWSIAAVYAARLLPGVFPPDDPVEALVLAPEHAKALRDHLRKLGAAVFAADDSLGWTYQFWRAAEKKAVNDSQVKIGAAELPAVTQLFTEPYMVRFLLHNTLGAWWAGKVLSGKPELARGAVDETALRTACALPGYAWEYLRFVREAEIWRPAAGTFPEWPQHAAGITLLDPCCGSGHFLTEALTAFAALRAVEESLPPGQAVTVALRDNVHGLEIDGRCVQIAAFALALTAWRIGGSEIKLPASHVAWVGGLPPLPKAEFASLGNGDVELRRGLEALHDLFIQAPMLGSLIEITGGDLVNPARIARIEESVATLVEKMREAEPDRSEGALAARGLADAASILSQRWMLQLTNVPFLTENKFSGSLENFIKSRFHSGRHNLSTVFLLRMLSLANPGGVVGLVSPQIWHYSKRYGEVRTLLSRNFFPLAFSRLGPQAFQHPDSNGEAVSLNIIRNSPPVPSSKYFSVDASSNIGPNEKASELLHGSISQRVMVESSNPDLNVIAGNSSQKQIKLGSISNAFRGISTSDSIRFIRRFWEVTHFGPRWQALQSTADSANAHSGMTDVVLWEEERGRLAQLAASLKHLNHDVQNWRRGKPSWGKRGVCVSQMAPFVATIYEGEIYDSNCCAIIPDRADDLSALWAFVSSESFGKIVTESVGNNRKVEVGTFLRVEFDLEQWRQAALSQLPNGVPEPFSDSPTQWLFHGHPRYAAAGTELHVALARLAGYKWPAEINAEMRLSAEARTWMAETITFPESDADGLLSLVPVLGERSLADRLRAYCASVWKEAWQAGTEAALVAIACERAKDSPPKQLTLDAWIRTHAARQHSKLFHDRPFLWWISDGRADGFTAVAHYHRLNRGNLERLTYTILGDWITRLGDDPRTEAAQVLQAKLVRILEGEAPFDIFIRWRPLDTQAIGWEPDLDDGVRQNIRPFIKVGVLSYDLTHILKAVDRGKDTISAPWFATFNGVRRNDHHTTLEQKRDARAAAAA